jgi:ribose transport system substrate-binding protein
MNDPGVTVDSGSFIVTAANVDTYDDERIAASDDIKKQFDDSLLDCK